MRILLTNDDGILAPGLAALVEAAEHLGRIEIVAPETAQSAAGHSITLTEPLICQQIKLPSGHNGRSVSGRPADCVKVAMVELLEQQPDLVFSGINAGANIGINVLYSGTVAAAVEGAFFGVPAVALSLGIYDKVDFDYAGRATKIVLDMLIENDLLQSGTVLNVNIPPCEIGWPKGIKVVRQGTRPFIDTFERRHDPRGRLYFWLANGEKDNLAMEEATDEEAITNGYISITPLQINLTDTIRLPELAENIRKTAPWPHKST